MLWAVQGIHMFLFDKLTGFGEPPSLQFWFNVLDLPFFAHVLFVLLLRFISLLGHCLYLLSVTVAFSIAFALTVSLLNLIFFLSLYLFAGK